MVCVRSAARRVATVQPLLPSPPGSVNEPRLKLWFSHSVEDWLAGAMTVGGTFATVAVKLFESYPPSLSVAVMVTVYVPLSRYAWDLAGSAPWVVWLKIVWVEPSPQLTSTD